MRERVSSDELFNTPNDYGLLQLDFQIKPVSLQSSKTKREIVTSSIRLKTTKFRYLLSSDVSIEIVWHINEDERYETDETADVDNIIKPILDALSGSDGIIIDDCQVQYISCHWVSRFFEEEHIAITIKHEPDAWYPKNSLAFVQLHKALCMPVNLNLPAQALRVMIDVFQYQLATREKLLAMGHDYEEARLVMSIQRVFHRTRVGGFQVFDIEGLLRWLEKQQSIQPSAGEGEGEVPDMGQSLN